MSTGIYTRTEFHKNAISSGMPEIENGRKLDVHHIDYNKHNLNINNLIALCRKCHPKTNSNRDFWQKYFQDIMENKNEKIINCINFSN